MAMRLVQPPRLPLIAPSILSADFAHMGRDCAGVLLDGADLLHLDVMDGHFVPNLTMGPALCRSLRHVLPDAYLDVHLMVTEPLQFIEPFAKAGANNVTFHVEAVAPGKVRDAVRQIREHGMEAGLAINPPTPLDAILPFVDAPDVVLVMSVNPGFSGRAFIDSTLGKARAISQELDRSRQRLEMDGGLTPENAPLVRAAGCDVLVAASAIFGVAADKRSDVIRTMRGHA